MTNETLDVADSAPIEIKPVPIPEPIEPVPDWTSDIQKQNKIWFNTLSANVNRLVAKCFCFEITPKYFTEFKTELHKLTDEERSEFLLFMILMAPKRSNK